MHTRSSVFRHFVILVLKIVGVFFALLVAFNLIIDPFHLYQAPLIPKFNQVKIELEKQNRLHKAVRIARQKPKILFLGSSRILYGFDPEFLSSLVQEEAYNAALVDANFEEIYHYFEHSLYHQPHLKTVIVGLDLFAFNKRKKPKEDFYLERLKTSSLIWKDICSSLLTKAAIRSSLQTMRENIFGHPVSYLLEKGQFNPLILKNKKSDSSLGEEDLKYIQFAFNQTDIYGDYELDLEKIQLFYQLVKKCQTLGIELYALICPTKAIYWEALYQKGLWPVLEKWKQLLSQAYPIWDFSGFNCITTATWSKEEALYFECSHFTPYVGNLILGKFFSISSLPSSFGYLLTPNSLQDALNHIRQEHIDWTSLNLSLVEKVKTTLNPSINNEAF